MRPPFTRPKASFDAEAVQETIRSALSRAGLDPAAAPFAGMTETLRRTLGAASQGPSASPVEGLPTGIRSRWGLAPMPPPVPDDRTGRSGPSGHFELLSHTGRAGTRSYKLYVPEGLGAAPAPLLVMLHGCTQSVDDFAAGTQMNRLADEHGLLVLYPEQPGSANASKCWNWFRAEDQVRDAGEPSLIAGIVRTVVARHGIDTRRIFVAGLSAGAAMAVILGETYPELFAAVGAHSGLAFGSAHDIPSALAAMKAGKGGLGGLGGLPGRKPARGSLGAAQAVPTIIFHGDRDHTVQAANGLAIVQQARDAFAAAGVTLTEREDTAQGTAPGGRRYSRALHADGAGRTCVEAWTVHGGGHAWSGGSERGSYTDPSGPDASAAMLRFFLDQPYAGSA